jgi:hypothetical protein
MDRHSIGNPGDILENSLGIQMRGVLSVGHEDVIDQPVADKLRDFCSIFGICTIAKSIMQIADQYIQLLMLLFVLLQFRIAGQLHTQFFLGAMVPDVIIQSMKRDLHLYRLNFAGNDGILDGMMQIIDDPQHAPVVVVKVLDADFQILGPHD